MKKNSVMILVTIGCLIVAGVVAATQMNGGKEDSQQADFVFICNDCGDSFPLSRKEWKTLSNEADRELRPVEVTCPHCGSTSTQVATKCEGCSTVVPDSKIQENGGKCPNCGQPVH